MLAAIVYSITYSGPLASSELELTQSNNRVLGPRLSIYAGHGIRNLPRRLFALNICSHDFFPIIPQFYDGFVLTINYSSFFSPSLYVPIPHTTQFSFYLFYSFTSTISLGHPHVSPSNHTHFPTARRIPSPPRPIPLTQPTCLPCPSLVFFILSFCHVCRCGFFSIHYLRRFFLSIFQLYILPISQSPVFQSLISDRLLSLISLRSHLLRLYTTYIHTHGPRLSLSAKLGENVVSM